MLTAVLALGQQWTPILLLPLAASISLVYSASRYELPSRIFRRSLRLFLTILVFMAVVYGLLYVLSFRL